MLCRLYLNARAGTAARSHPIALWLSYKVPVWSLGYDCLKNGRPTRLQGHKPGDSPSTRTTAVPPPHWSKLSASHLQAKQGPPTMDLPPNKETQSTAAGRRIRVRVMEHTQNSGRRQWMAVQMLSEPNGIAYAAAAKHPLMRVTQGPCKGPWFVELANVSDRRSPVWYERHIAFIHALHDKYVGNWAIHDLPADTGIGKSHNPGPQDIKTLTKLQRVSKCQDT